MGEINYKLVINRGLHLQSLQLHQCCHSELRFMWLHAMDVQWNVDICCFYYTIYR